MKNKTRARNTTQKRHPPRQQQQEQKQVSQKNSSPSEIPSLKSRTSLPINWPPEITYLTSPAYSKYVTPSQLAVLRTPPPPAVLQPGKQGPSQDEVSRLGEKGAGNDRIPREFPLGPNPSVRIERITDPRHPAHGQCGLFAARDLMPGELVVVYYGVLHWGSATNFPASTHNTAISSEDPYVASSDTGVPVTSAWSATTGTRLSCADPGTANLAIRVQQGEAPDQSKRLEGEGGGVSWPATKDREPEEDFLGREDVNAGDGTQSTSRPTTSSTTTQEENKIKSTGQTTTNDNSHDSSTANTREEDELREREAEAAQHEKSDYDLWLSREADVAVDAEVMGNEARFVNDYRGVPDRPNGQKANAEFRVVWDPRVRHCSYDCPRQQQYHQNIAGGGGGGGVNGSGDGASTTGQAGGQVYFAEDRIATATSGNNNRQDGETERGQQQQQQPSTSGTETEPRKCTCKGRGEWTMAVYVLPLGKKTRLKMQQADQKQQQGRKGGKESGRYTSINTSTTITSKASNVGAIKKGDEILVSYGRGFWEKRREEEWADGGNL